VRSLGQIYNCVEVILAEKVEITTTDYNVYTSSKKALKTNKYAKIGLTEILQNNLCIYIYRLCSTI